MIKVHVYGQPHKPQLFLLATHLQAVLALPVETLHVPPGANSGGQSVPCMVLQSVILTGQRSDISQFISWNIFTAIGKNVYIPRTCPDNQMLPECLSSGDLNTTTCTCPPRVMGIHVHVFPSPVLLENIKTPPHVHVCGCECAPTILSSQKQQNLN